MQVPAESRLLIVLASLLVPNRDRVDWRHEWLGELWHWMHGRTRPAILQRAASAFHDAIFLYETAGGLRQSLASATAHPVLPVVALATAWLAIAGSTSLFAHSRRLSHFLRAPASWNLVTIARPNAYRVDRLPASQARLFASTAPTLRRVAMWSLHREAMRVLEAEPAFVDLLRSEGAPAPRFDVLIVQPASGFQDRFVGVLAEKWPESTCRDVERDLSRSAQFQRDWGRPAVKSVAEPLAATCNWIVNVALLSVLGALWLHLLRVGWPGSLFTIKLALIGALLITGPLEFFASRAQLQESGAISPFLSCFAWLTPLWMGAVAVWWLHHDEVMRCRTCGRRLDAPLSVGAGGRAIFEPSGTEWMCPCGHGTLILAGEVSYAVNAGWFPSCVD